MSTRSCWGKYGNFCSNMMSFEIFCKLGDYLLFEMVRAEVWHVKLAPFMGDIEYGWIEHLSQWRTGCPEFREYEALYFMKSLH